MSNQALDDEVSYIVSLSNYNTNGFCRNFTLRRSKWEAEANAGSHEARVDWIKYIGPLDEFGGCNPINGNFSAVVLPLIKPERLRVVAYILEYGFLYDDLIEVANPNCCDTETQEDQRAREWRYTDPALGKTKIQAKSVAWLTSIDPSCAERVKRTWKSAMSIVSPNKDTLFNSLDEYLDYRLVDGGTSFVEALLLFGMGVTLTEEEDALLDPIRRPCFVALCLANDYLSFDREYSVFLGLKDSTTLKNAVWVHMQMYHVDVDVAKKMVLDATREYEARFLENCAKFQQGSKGYSDKLRRHLDALSYEVAGNVVWSLNCPRYCPDYRYEPNTGIEDELTARSMPETLGMKYEARISQKAKESLGQLSITKSGLEHGHPRNSSVKALLTASNDTGSTSDRSLPP